MLIRTSVPGFRNRVYKTAHGLMVPLFDAFLPKHNNVLAVLETLEGKLLIPAANIVTNAGDTHYAQRGCGESPTNAFGISEMASAGTPGKAATRASFTYISGSQKSHSSTYPKTNDADPDNTGGGADVISYLASYAKADFNHAAISHGMVTNTSPAAGEALLTGYTFSSPFEKTADDTLKVFVNHTMNGV